MPKADAIAAKAGEVFAACKAAVSQLLKEDNHAAGAATVDLWHDK